MEQVKESSTIAAVCDKGGADAERMEGYLRVQGLSARWYPLRDLDDVDREVCAGRTQRVVLVNWSDLLQAIWNGEVTFDRWLKMGAVVEFVESPGARPADCLTTLSQAWSAHQRARRRRQTMSGLVLSAIVLAAAFIVVQF